MLQFISHHNDRFSYFDSIKLALEGGCKWIQIRCKEYNDEQICELAKRVKPLCEEHRAALILDDRVHLVKQCGADGVHLGLNDMPINEARKILSANYIIGGTANTISDIELHFRNGANYIGCGPFRFTTTKKNLSPLLGLEGYKNIINLMKERQIDIPLIAIGGITKSDIIPLLNCGISGIALSSAILNADDPINELKEIINICNNG